MVFYDEALKAQPRKDKITDKSYNFISRQNKIFIEQIVGLVGFVLQKYCKGWFEIYWSVGWSAEAYYDMKEYFP